MTKDTEFPCPCSSGKPYQQCCEVYHLGKIPESAVALMRSRYSAYALNHIDYIVRTTHPRHPAVAQNLAAWKEEILKFCMQTDFEKLEVIDSKESGDRAAVIFIAHLKQGEDDVTFTERSYFAKVNGVWLYVNGDIYPGENRSLKL